MPNTFEMTGLEDLVDSLEDLGEELAIERHREALHDAIIREYRRNKSKIPKDSGALMRSLLRRGDRAHIFEIPDARHFRFGSKLPQAKYQSARMPAPSPDNIAKGYLDAVWNAVGGD